MGSNLINHFMSGTPWSPTGPAHQNYAPWELPSQVMNAYRNGAPQQQAVNWPGQIAQHQPTQMVPPAALQMPQIVAPPRQGMLQQPRPPARPQPRAAAPVSVGKNAFITSMRSSPEVAEAAARLGVPKDWIIAQAALESGWGRSAPGNNLFGVKAMGRYKGPSTVQNTREVRDGKDVREAAAFRAYGSFGKSVTDYADLIAGSRRYAAALNAETPEEFFSALQRGGYATDPNYATTAAAIARQIGG